MMSSKTPPDEYKTSDLYFAAYLQTAGVPMCRTERNSGNKVSFVFDASIANIEELNRAWFSRKGKIEALPYADTVKSLKSVCHLA